MLLCSSVWEPRRRASVLLTPPKPLAMVCESVTLSPTSRPLRTSQYFFNTNILLEREKTENLSVPTTSFHWKTVFPHRFRMLAEHFLTMYPNLKIDIEGELEQLKVRACQKAHKSNKTSYNIYIFLFPAHIQPMVMKRIKGCWLNDILIGSALIS